MKRLLLLTCTLLCFTITYAQSEEKELATADSLLDTDPEKALSMLNNMITRYGEKETFLTKRGYAYITLKQNDKARNEYKRAIELNANCGKCYFNLGYMALDENNHQAALVYFTKYIEIEPAKPDGYVKRGEARYHRGDFTGALTDLNNALEMDPKSPYIFLWLSMTKLDLGKASQALDDINASIKLLPDVEYGYFVRAKCYIDLQEYEKAIADLEYCIKKRNDFDQYHLYHGIAFQSMFRYAEAETAFTKAINLKPGDIYLYQERGRSRFYAGNFDAACADFQEMIDSWVQNSVRSWDSASIKKTFNYYCNPSGIDYYRSRGEALLQMKEYEKAEKMFMEGIGKFKNEPYLYRGLAAMKIGSGLYKDAIKTFEQAITIATGRLQESKNNWVYFIDNAYDGIAFAYVNAGETDSAIAVYGRNIERSKQNSGYREWQYSYYEKLLNRGNLYATLGKYKEAEADIREVLRNDKYYTNARYALARFLLNKNTIGTTNRPVLRAVASIDPAKIDRTAPKLKPGADKSEIEQVIADCNDMAFGLSESAEVFELRAKAKYLLRKSGYCDDLKKAIQLSRSPETLVQLPGCN